MKGKRCNTILHYMIENHWVEFSIETVEKGPSRAPSGPVARFFAGPLLLKMSHIKSINRKCCIFIYEKQAQHI